MTWLDKNGGLYSKCIAELGIELYISKRQLEKLYGKIEAYTVSFIDLSFMLLSFI